MTSKYLLSAAGVALVALASTGAARAADIAPIVVPVMTPVVVPPVGPTIAIKIETGLNVGYDGDFDAWVNTLGDFKITAASGWGFQLIAGGNQYLVAPIQFFGGATARVFHAGDTVELGVYAGFDLSPTTINTYEFGGDFAYDTDRLTVESFVEANFTAGAFVFLDTRTEATVHVNERLDLIAGGRLQTNFTTTGYQVWAGAKLDLGLLAPYATVAYGNALGITGEVGVELEKQIGTGPLSLIGYAEADFGAPGPFVAVGLGIRFSRGDVDN